MTTLLLKLYSCWDIFVAAPDEKTARRLAVPTLKETFKAHTVNDEIRAHCADTGVHEITKPIPWYDSKQEIMRQPQEIILLSGGTEGVCGVGGDLFQ